MRSRNKSESQILANRAQDEEQFAFDGTRNQQSYLPQDRQEGY